MVVVTSALLRLPRFYRIPQSLAASGGEGPARSAGGGGATAGERRRWRRRGLRAWASAGSLDGNCRRLAEAPKPGVVEPEGIVGVGNFGRRSESGSDCVIRPGEGGQGARLPRAQVRCVRSFHTRGRRARARGRGGGAARKGRRRRRERRRLVCAPWVVSPACGMGNEAFLRSNSITSFSSQEPAAAAATT
ncbi:PREDICTED: uncharacterized protein LOC105510716 [Colobus angolensis palliatus]|uniref:uncharacterized protein LOC105510716 n=1 Tax=Colobus angolensis palliatus TaxID=336983 RepID=UPI0005F3A930|nr:PREDICTED: uncharacterized protein LOC105510716 [Colobus angolensis palliatus]